MASSMAITAVVGANTQGFSAGMKSVQGGLARSGGSMGRFASMATLGFAAVAVAAAAAAAVIFVSFAVKATKAFIEFEETMIKTAAIMGKTSMDEIPEITAKVEELGRTTKSTAQEVAEAAQILALAGLGKDDLVDKGALEALNNLSIAAGVDIPTAAAIAISSLKGMGLETAELQRINDVLLNTMTSTFTDIQSLGEALKFLTPTARAAGISIEEAAAAVGILGNAGMQGSMAGTALRMAITKLLKPSDDARKIIEKLGLDFYTLTPAGQAAKMALRQVSSALEASKIEAAATNAAMKSLNEELSDLSIDQQQNSLAIMKIKRKAEREGRELTNRETEQIGRLESANADLNITMSERRIEQQIMSAEQKRVNENVSQQTKEYGRLNKEVAEQTTGLTSMSDVFNQLADAGATTNQMLQIFGIRGGTAAMALLNTVDELDNLIESNKGATAAFGGLGRTAEIVAVQSTATAMAVYELNSAWTAFLIKAGEEFAPMLKDEVIPALIDFIGALLPLIPTFAEIAVALGEALPPLLEAIIPLIGHFAEMMILLAPLIKLVGYAMEFLFYFMEPVYRLLGHIAGVIVSIIELDFDGFIEHLLGAFGALFEVLMPVWRILSAIGSMLGFDIGGAVGGFAESIGFNTTTGAAGAGIGMMVGGPVGAAVGGAIGGFLFAEGGIINEPTLGMVGEAGPEAVIPLDRLDGLIASSVARSLAGRQGSGKPSIQIHGGIHIGAGNNLNKADVKSALESVLPRILTTGTARGARGVI